MTLLSVALALLSVASTSFRRLGSFIRRHDPSFRRFLSSIQRLKKSCISLHAYTASIAILLFLQLSLQYNHHENGHFQ